MKRLVIATLFGLLIEGAGFQVLAQDANLGALSFGPGGSNTSASSTIETDEFTGAATNSITISVPPARGGITPNLILNYNSQRRNLNSWVGLGWELDIGSIIRTPENGHTDYLNGRGFEVRLAGQSDALNFIRLTDDLSEYGIPLPENQEAEIFQAKIESSYTHFIHVRSTVIPFVPFRIDHGWIAIDKGGNRYFFGSSDASREIPLAGDLRIFASYRIGRWMLERVTDPNGNELQVTYGSDKLPRAIQYQNIKITFDKGNGGALDDDLAYFPIFREDFTSRREMYRVLNAIIIYREVAADRFRRLQRLAFTYQTSNTRRVRELRSVQQFGADDSENLPPVTIDYYGEDGFSFPASSFSRQASRGDHNGLIDEGATFADMNGDGLIDQVFANEDGSFNVYFNNGNEFVLIPGESLWTDPFPCGGPDIGDGDDPPCAGKLNAFRGEHQWLFLMDINGDSLPDRIGRVITPAGPFGPETAVFRIAFNTGHGWDPDTVEWKDPYYGSWAGTADRGKGFADMNGDGLVDRIWGDGDNDSFRVYYNTGAGFKRNPVIWDDPKARHGDVDGKARLFDAKDGKTYVSIRDINGDGLPDRVYQVDLEDRDGVFLSGGFGIALNVSGTGWAQPESVPDSPGLALYNGYDTILTADPSEDEDSRGYLDEKHDLIDVNGDGFLDRVEGDPDSCQLRFFTYQGMTDEEDFAQLSSPLELADPVQDPPGIDGDWKACGYLHRDKDKNQFVFFQDLTGDNLPDRMVSRQRNDDRGGANFYDLYPLRLNDITFSDTPSWWDNNKISQPIGALREIADGRGSRTAIEYRPSTGRRDSRIRDDRFLPFNLNLVHNVYTLDHTLTTPIEGLPEAERHPGMRWTNYRFRGGNFFVRHAIKASDDIEDDEVSRPFFSRFNGFQEVTKTTVRGPGESWRRYATTTRFHQAVGDVDPWGAGIGDVFDRTGYTHLALSGKPYLQFVEEEGGREAVRHTSRWEVNATPGSNFDCTAPPGEVSLCYPRLVSQAKLVREEGADTPRTSRVDHEYDAIGNVTAERTFDGDALFLSKETTYYPPETFGALFIRDRPHVQIKKDAGDVVFRKKEFAYDVRGNPEREILFANADGSETLSVQRSFRPDGNLEQVTDIDGVTKRISYDGDGLFPIREAVTGPDGIDLVTSRVFNRLNGQIADEFGPQGVGKRILFDSLGRPVEEQVISRPGSSTVVKRYEYTYLPLTIDGVENIILQRTRIWEPQPDQPLADDIPMEVSYQDGGGQLLQKCVLSERGDYRVVQFRVRNGGREEIQTEPFFQAVAGGNCNFLSSLSPGSRLFRKTKDLMGRVTYSEPPPGDPASPVGTVAVNYQNTGEGRLRKTATDSRGRTTVETFDANDRLTEVIDPAGTAMQYVYNPVGDLRRVSAGGSDLSVITYDLLGRKTDMVDADMGHWQYRYDSFGRLERQIDNKGQVIRHFYDTIGRITRKESYGVGDVLEKREVYTYDSGGEGFDILPGELYQIEEFDSGGSSVRRTRYGYDPDFRRTETLARFIPSVGEFRQRLTHDFRGRVRQTVFPGGHTLQYSYMLNGNLQSVACSSCPPADGDSYYRINPDTAFDVFGALLREEYGDGTAGEYEYFPLSHRLQRKRILQGETVLSERTYEYDESANIRRLDDPLDARGSGELTEVVYDNLDRLTSYTGPERASSLEYDPSGNIFKNRRSYGEDLYQYESPRPHAVTRIGDRRFDYDENGNMTSDPDRRMTYNAQNQLARVEMINGDVVAYDYDYTGARVKKTATKTDPYHRVTQAMTHFLGDALEVRGDQMILNIYAGSRRVATRTVGSLGDAGIGGGTLVDRGFDPVLNPTLAMPGLFMLATLFLLGSLRPVPLRVPQWVYAYIAPRPPLTLRGGVRGSPPLNLRGGWEGLQGALKGIYLTWRSWRRLLQETLFCFPQRSFAKAFLVFWIVLSIIQPTTLLFAGDEGVPETPVSDPDFFYYHHDDHLGSSHILTEGKSEARHAGVTYRRGEILQRFEYAPFGQESFALNPNLKFDPSYTGQMYDIETGLYYYKSRYYNPVLARFIQPDTVVPDAGNLQAYNRYSYVNNNPLKYIDPTGHGFWSWFKKLFGAFFGALISVVTGFALTAIGVAAFWAGVAAGAAGGLIGGAISGGLKGALLGGLLGALGGAAFGGANAFLKDTLKITSDLGRVAILAGVGASISGATGGWKGLLIFGAGLAGAAAGYGIGKPLGARIAEAKAAGENGLTYKPGKVHLEGSGSSGGASSNAGDGAGFEWGAQDGGGVGVNISGESYTIPNVGPGQSIGSALKVDVGQVLGLGVRAVTSLAGIGASIGGGYLVSAGFGELSGLGSAGFLVALHGIGGSLLIVGAGTLTVGVGALLVTESLGVTNFSGVNSR